MQEDSWGEGEFDNARPFDGSNRNLYVEFLIDILIPIPNVLQDTCRIFCFQPLNSK